LWMLIAGAFMPPGSGSLWRASPKIPKIAFRPPITTAYMQILRSREELFAGT